MAGVRRGVCRLALPAAVLLLLVAAVSGGAAARRLLQDEEAEGEAGGDEFCVTGEFPLAFKHTVDFNVNEGIGPLRDDSTNLECHCEGHRCGCTGEGEDCDEYSQGWFLLLAYAHQLGAFAYDLPKYNAQYHLESMLVWGIIGLVLGWLGFLTVLYMEVKAVSVTRERDEREKLVAIRAMERTSRMVELDERDARTMAPRAYVSICGGVLLFVGLFCQLIPFCHVLSELGLPVAFHGFCPLFVFTSSIMLTTCIVLLILGVVWSCTRGWAALVLLVILKHILHTTCCVCVCAGAHTHTHTHTHTPGAGVAWGPNALRGRGLMSDLGHPGCRSGLPLLRVPALTVPRFAGKDAGVGAGSGHVRGGLRPGQGRAGLRAGGGKHGSGPHRQPGVSCRDKRFQGRC